MALRGLVLGQRAPRGNYFEGDESEAQEQLNEAIEARQRREWDRALKLLRRWREYISPALLSYVRGRIWEEAGYLPRIA